jgi:S1-C subfamily serine protease
VVIEVVKKDGDDEPADFQQFETFFRDREGDGEKDAGKERPRLRGESHSEGSGFVIRPDGFILTNLHVIADAGRIEVRMKDGRRFPAKITGTDDTTDIAVIKIDAKDLSAVEFGDSDALKIGQLVCAIGAPYNQEYSFTCGWVSGKGRTNLLEPASRAILYEDYIQTDAFINPGNSGGPLFDVDGKIVGMNTLINGIGRGLAFAIPSAMLADVSAQLIVDGKVRRSWIGVRVRTLADSPLLRKHFQESVRTLAESAPQKEGLQGIDSGVVVSTIEADAPALKAGIRVPDVITHVDGVAISVPQDLQKQIAKKKVGQVVQLNVWRAGRTVEIPVTTGELPAEFTRVSNTPKAKPIVPTAETLGMNLKGVDGRAIVTEVTADGPAAKSGLQADDIITDVDSKAVASPVAVFENIAAGAGKAGKKGVLLNIERKGKRTFVLIEPGG